MKTMFFFLNLFFIFNKSVTVALTVIIFGVSKNVNVTFHKGQTTDRCVHQRLQK